MSKGKAASFNMIRAWATSASPYYALQTSPGNFSEPIFRGLDYALDQARQQSLKVCCHAVCLSHIHVVHSYNMCGVSVHVVQIVVTVLLQTGMAHALKFEMV